MTVTGDGKLVIFGGHDGTKMLCDVHVLDTTIWTWSQPHQKGEVSLIYLFLFFPL
jgi:hypothetical protein